MINRRFYVRLGLTYLEEVVLDVLQEAREKGEALEPAQISRRAGIPGYRTNRKKYHGIVWTILPRLEADGRIEKRGRKWILPEQPQIPPQRDL